MCLQAVYEQRWCTNGTIDSRTVSLEALAETRVSSVRIMLSGNLRSKSGETYREKHQDLFLVVSELAKEKLLPWIDGTKWVGMKQPGYAHDGSFLLPDWFNPCDVQ